MVSRCIIIKVDISISARKSTLGLSMSTGMVINSECWNIIIDENMKEAPSSFPGSSSVKLTHDFCHVDSDNSDDVYTNFSFVEMGGRTIWPFYTTESFQEDMDLG